MANVRADRQRAIRAVEALFERYRLLAAQRPEHHVVSDQNIQYGPNSEWEEDFDSEVMNNMKLIDAGPEGSVVFELYISPNFSNLNDVMHGGAAGVIFDMATTAALCPVAQPGYWEFMGGVTRSLNISYLKAVPIGVTVRLSSKVVSVGKQMALIQGVMTSLDGKLTYCAAEHHKVNAPVKEHHRRMRIPWDDEFEKEWAAKKATARSKI